MDWERWRLIRRTSERHEYWIFSTRFNRPLSNVITYFLLETRITPNQVSLLTIPVALLSSISYIKGKLALGGLLFHFSSILDGVDGEIARARGIASPLGRVIDSLCDRFVEASVCLSIGYHSFVSFNSPLGFLFSTIGLIGLFFDPYLAELIKARTGRPLHDATKLIESRLRFSLADRGFRIFVVMIASILGRPELGLLFVGILSLLYATAKFLCWLKIKGRF